MTKKLNYNPTEKITLKRFAKGMFTISFAIVILGEFAEWFGRLIGHILR